MDKIKTLNILGTPYDYIETHNQYDTKLEHQNGVTNYDKKYIVIDMTNESKEDIERIKRHEILHAFIREAGLEELNTETYIDFLACQMPKLQKLFKEVESEV